jgi:hypothetical protein
LQTAKVAVFAKINPKYRNFLESVPVVSFVEPKAPFVFKR